MIRNQKGRRNVSTFVMVELGLKLDDLLKQKGLENNVTNSFDKLVDEEKVPLPTLAKPLVTKNVNSTIKDKIDTRNFFW